MQFVLFTDNLADLSIPQACTGAKDAGFDGLDLTLRPGGHVRPENAEMGLSVHEAVDAAGMTIPMVSTAITDADSPHAEAIFAAAAHYGARRLKLGYWEYRPFGRSPTRSRRPGQAQEARQARPQYQVLPCVHCHSGRFIASGGAMLYLILRDFDPADVGAYVDPMHMTIEGAAAGGGDETRLGRTLACPGRGQELPMASRGHYAAGQQRFRWEYCPLADGQAPLPEFVAYLKQLKYDGIVSLHSEYKGETSFRRLTTPELLKQSAVDLAYVRRLFN